jgi:hypothetical protein
MTRLHSFVMAASVTILLLTLSACGSANAPTPVTIAEACAPEKDGKQATVRGYFQLSSMVFCTDSCNLDFAEQPGGESPLAPDIKVGSGRNQMKTLPENFKDNDFQVTSQDGTVLGLKDAVQISGKMSIAPNVCLMYVDKIHPAP